MRTTQDFSRRGLLKATAVTGASAVVLPGIAAAEAPGASALASEAGGATCGPAKLTGRIVRPNDPDYANASLGWDELFRVPTGEPVASRAVRMARWSIASWASQS
ncbi:twin-arginine translocation signal domain-containing protein [Streptomyces sp. NBC_01571]|uniref:twin-arginine translocation signal domain-containing protein n=1 Tax=Streptomyces sp. NBC_01571 TaxID=2975883 RepID=UPI00225101E1|nr:twin-arginine translocation signal domain-containing protein [Streptomyces sp. NBC_01571]MCX4574943.1 twin-arginine translocation signal domain-containing protein [Streptomyces sp. NBC_01571]